MRACVRARLHTCMRDVLCMYIFTRASHYIFIIHIVIIVITVQHLRSFTYVQLLLSRPLLNTV